MSKKRVSYQNLLKQAIAEYDTTKSLEVKGPMLDPILSWDGGGEVPTYKDAASILERYYFNETEDKGVEVAEMDYENEGFRPKTVFACGAVVIDKQLIVYYGAGDTFVCAASVDIRKLLKELEKYVLTNK